MNSTSFNSNRIHLVIIAKLRTGSSQSTAIIPYKVDTVSDGNLMTYHIIKNILARASKEKIAATREITIVLKHRKTKLQKLGICSVTVINSF